MWGVRVEFLVFTWNAKTGEPKDLVGYPSGVGGARDRRLGFEDVRINYHTQSYEGREIELYTIVGKRTHGRVVS
jgi:hypothetical protein